MTRETVHASDALEAMRGMSPESFDAMLTDPPYGLRFMGKRWDYDVPSVETWREALRVLKPGAHALVACGTRTQHRMVVNLEDAGFEVRDVIAWLYGQGFPKSMQVPSPGWDGYGTALKPAMELWTLVRKPLDGTVAANALKHGVGGLNIDGSRIPVAPEDAEASNRAMSGARAWGRAHQRGAATINVGDSDMQMNPAGRWPANVIHDGSDEVLAGFPDTESGGTPFRRSGMGHHGANGQELVNGDGGSFGSAARFFYCAKADTSERDAGLNHMPLRDGGIKNASGRGYSERDPYVAVKVRNPHPTVKPIALTTYLARLLLPPERDTPRRILIPFAGTGSEIIGARLAGWDEAIGIELEPEYAAIAEARIRHHTDGRLW